MTTNVSTHYEVTYAGAGQTNGVVTKYYYAGSQRIAMRQDGDLFFIIGDHLGSTSLVTDANGTKVSEIRYKAWGEVRYESGASPTEYTYTGQYSYTADFGLMFYNARWYDPGISHFTQPDSIVPDPHNPLDWNRYSYVRYNPLRYTDPTGHAPSCDDGPQTWANCKQQLNSYAKKTVRQLSGIDDLKAITNIVDYASFLYPDYEEMIPALSEIFIGIHESNPYTIYNAMGADPCAAVGREPKDCSPNEETGEVFWDTGFHPDYQDGHSQAFHFWAYLATTASTDMPGGYLHGRQVGNVANFVHEILAFPNDVSGATWQDYALSQKAMDIGEMVATNAIQSSELGNYIMEQVGPNSGGAPWVQVFVKYFPLKGNPK